MKANIKRLFSSFEIEDDQFNVKQKKIELVSCPLREMMCKFHLSAVNKSYLESEQYRKQKDFHRSIEMVKTAFNKTLELMEHPCTRCIKHYHSNIIDSLEKIHGELEEISTGIFGNKRYQSSYLQSIKVLKEFESMGLNNDFQLNESNERFLGNYLN